VGKRRLSLEEFEASENTMNLKKWIPLVAAVLLGVIALVVAKKALVKSSGADGKTATAAVVVAKRDIPPGREITADDLTTVKIDTSSLPGQQFFTRPEDLIGRTALYPMSKSQTVVEQVLAPTGTRGGLTALIPAGMRAMTIEVNEFTGVAGMIQPGSKVDIIAVLRDEKNGQPAARTILQNIEVRAVGANVNPVQAAEGGPQRNPSANVTLLLTPKQTQIMQLASQNGRPWLVLRNGRDPKETEADLTTLAELRNEAARIEGAGPTTNPAATAIAAADPFAKPTTITSARVVQVIRGGVESTVTFNENGPTTPSHNIAAQPQTRPTAPKNTGNEGRFVTDADDGLIQK
jgi:pilus assembly protein CpaB